MSGVCGMAHSYPAVACCRWLVDILLAAGIGSLIMGTAQAAPEVFKDCSDCPAMVVIPSGSYLAGSTAEEAEREHIAASLAAREQPQREVKITRKFALSKFELTRDEFARFVKDTGWKADGPCAVLEGPPTKPWIVLDDRGWDNPGFQQTGDHPVVCVNLRDAHAYTNWLSTKTGARYRLPSGAEWEYAARAGSTTARPWGDSRDDACLYANGMDQSRAKLRGGNSTNPDAYFQCEDGYAETAPVGSFKPNAFGLYDMLGNVNEWTADCVNPNQIGAPNDARVRRTGDCNAQVDRGGAWGHSPKYVRTATQHSDLVGARNTVVGIRLAREID